MSISYKESTLQMTNMDGASIALTECSEFFQNSENVNIVAGFDKIAINESYWSTYKDKILFNTDMEDRENLDQLFENSRNSILSEAVTGITPISSLTIPTIRRLWPKLSMKHVIPTEVVRLPKFTISYLVPVLIKDGVKHKLPESIIKDGSAEQYNLGTPVYQGEIKLEDFQIDSTTVDGALKGFKLLENLPNGVQASATIGDSIDPDFAITSVGIECTVQSGSKEVVWFDTNITANLDSTFYKKFEKMYKPGDLDESGALKGSAAYTNDILFGHLDFTTGIFNLSTSTNAIKAVKVRGRLSPEYNNRSESVSFEIVTRDVTVGTGSHINAPITTEMLQDVSAMYKIDAAAKIVDIMTNVFATRLDQEQTKFIIDASIRSNKYQAKFNCKPLKGFSGSPKQWREQLKDVFDYQAQKMKEDTYFEGGTFVIVGNPRDIALIPNITWTYEGKSAKESSGVEVSYQIGAWSGLNNYKIVSSISIPQGKVYMIFTSNLDEQMTYKYYPYSFSVEKNYLDPNFQNVPSIMMAKRHKLEVFRDCILTVDIENNTGDPNFTGVA